MAKLKQIKFGSSLNQIAKTIVNGKGVISVTTTQGFSNLETEDNDYSYDIDVNVDGTTIVKNVDKLAVGTVPAEQVSVAAGTGLEATNAQNAFKELKSAIDTVEGAAKSYTIVKKTDGLATNVKEQYQLQDEKSTPVGEPIKIYKDGSLDSVELVGQELVFKYNLATGEQSTIIVDVSTFLAESEFKAGLEVNGDGQVSVKVDATSESFLTVSENGVKLSGVQGAINAAIEALDVTDPAVTGQYVSAVSETNGKVAISRANVSDAVLNGYAKGEKPASTEIGAGDDVKSAISKLEHQVDDAKAAATAAAKAATTKVVEGTDTGNNLEIASAKDSDGSTTYTINLTDVASKAALEAEIAARKAVDGQTGQIYAANTGTNYISGATSLNDADVKLDAELQKEADRAKAAEQEIATKVNDIKYNVDGTTLIVAGISLDSTLK